MANDQKNTDLLEERLKACITNGLSVEEGIRRIIAGPGILPNSVSDSVLSGSSAVIDATAAVADVPAAPDVVHIYPDALGAVVTRLVENSTPLSIAILAKQLFGTPGDVVMAVQGGFPNYSALEMAQLLVNEDLYPGIVYADMQQALTAGQYSNDDILAALTAIFGPPAVPIEVNFIDQQFVTTNASVETGPGTMFNNYYGGSWIMHYPGTSYFSISYNHVKSGFSKVNLVLLDLASNDQSHAGYSPIDILVNGQTIRSQFNTSGGYQWDTFDITTAVAEGDNMILLNFCNGARTNYWLRMLKVEYLK